MKITFEKMSSTHGKDIIDIYNHYVTKSLAAYPEKAVPYSYFDKFLRMAEGYPAYAILTDGKTAGFCFLHPYKPLSTFSKSAEITYFLHQDFRGQGLGKRALQKLENDAKEMGITVLLANIASENAESIAFHRKNGFRECGRFQGIISKMGRQFDIVWMQKEII